MSRILHVIDTTGPGGAETVFVDLADRLREKGYDTIVLLRGPGWVQDELRRRELKPILLDAKGSFNWRYLLSLVRLVKDERIDLIQSHLLGSNVYCAVTGWITQKPVVATFHGPRAPPRTAHLPRPFSPSLCSESLHAHNRWLRRRGTRKLGCASLARAHQDHDRSGQNHHSNNNSDYDGLGIGALDY